MPKLKRIYIVVTPSFDERLDKWSARLGVSKAQLAAMCAHSGLDSIVRAIYPAESLPPEIIASWVEAFAKRGLDVEKFKKEFSADGAEMVELEIIPTNGE